MGSKYLEIANLVKGKIQDGTYLPGSQLPTEHELCKTFHVSRQTIRRAMDTLIEGDLIRRQQGSGSWVKARSDTSLMGLASQRSVAVITSYISDYIFPSILREIEDTLSQHSCIPSLFATQNKVSLERKILLNLLNLPLEGILVEGTKTALPNPNLDLYRRFIDRGIPVLFMNGNYNDLENASFVLDDNVGGAIQLVDYLISKGHTRIMGIFKSDDIQGHGRYTGYTTALQNASLPVDDDIIFWYDTNERASILSKGFENHPIVDRCMETDCTAVLCYNDEIAFRLILALQKKGASIPEDLAIVSFDNSSYCELSPVPITSLSHGDQNVGRIAAEKLQHLMNGESVHCEYVPWKLIERASSKFDIEIGQS